MGTQHRAGGTSSPVARWWPPRDTDRNRFLVRLQAVLYGLVTVYFLVFALASGAFLPWAIFTVALAATVVTAVALLLMRAQRQ